MLLNLRIICDLSEVERNVRAGQIHLESGGPMIFTSFLFDNIWALLREYLFVPSVRILSLISFSPWTINPDRLVFSSLVNLI